MFIGAIVYYCFFIKRTEKCIIPAFYHHFISLNKVYHHLLPSYLYAILGILPRTPAVHSVHLYRSAQWTTQQNFS